MKKRIWVFLMVILILFAVPSLALAEPENGSESEGGATGDAEIMAELLEQIGEYDINQWQAYPDASSGGRQLLPLPVREMILRYASGQASDDPLNVFSYLLDAFTGSVKEHARITISIFATAVLGGIVQALYANKSGSKLKEILLIICFSLSITVIIGEFSLIAAEARNAIDKCGSFVDASLPALTAMLTAVGNVSAGGVYRPLMGMLTNTVIVVMRSVVLPIVLCGGVVGVLNHLTERVHLSNMFTLSKTAAKWIIGIMSTVFFSITAIQGMVASTYDSVSIRTAKYTIDKAVPIVGGMISGTIDTVLGCGILLKNAAGITAILIVASIIAAPLMRIAGLIFTCRITAAICEPVTDKRLAKMLSCIAEVSTYLFAAVAAVGAMFAITVGLIVATGNASLMAGG